MAFEGLNSIGVKLFNGQTELEGLYEIPDLGGDVDAIEITTLSDTAHTYIEGLKNYGDNLPFKFYYEEGQFSTLSALSGSQSWKVQLPDGATCSFTGTCSVKLDGVGINSALSYTLSIKPNSEMVWA